MLSGKEQVEARIAIALLCFPTVLSRHPSVECFAQPWPLKLYIRLLGAPEKCPSNLRSAEPPGGRHLECSFLNAHNGLFFPNYLLPQWWVRTEDRGATKAVCSKEVVRE